MLSFSHTLCYHDLNYILQEICDSMIKSMSKSILKKRLGGHCVDIEGCNQVVLCYCIDYSSVIIFYT